MSKLIIWCPGRLIVNGSKRRTFQWNSTFNCYVHENRAFDEIEFNKVVEGVFKKNADLRPCVRVVEFSDAPVLAPVATISGGAEVTLVAALEVVQRQAPEKLRKTHTGGRPPKNPPDQMAVG